MKIRTVKARLYLFAIFIVAMFFVFGFYNQMCYASSNISCEYLPGSNINDNNYTNWNRNGHPVYSYLTVDGNGYMRVQGNVAGQEILIAYYDSEFELVSRREIAKELPVLGAFYETTNNYFIVSGQNNPDESRELEVFRITKYDKSWNRLGSCSLYGANTETPFRAGSCRIDSSGKYLLIRTSHRMFASDDGKKHQANVTIQVDTDNMIITDSHTSVENNSCGYVSHSFNQFIKLENNKIVSVDHGDAHPRSICLMKYPTNISEGTFRSNNVATINVMNLPGASGNNDTGATVGGFEISSSSYLIAGSAISENCTDLMNGTRNAFVASVDKSSNAVSINWLTSYEEGETGVGNPFLIKISNDSYMAFWGRENTVFYTKIRANGTRNGQIYSMDGNLSDCVPIVSNNRVIWFTWDNKEETFYTISVNNLSQHTKSTTIYDHDYKHIKTEGGLATLECKKCGNETTGRVPTSFLIVWNNTSPDEDFSFSTPDCDIEDTVYYWIYRRNYSANADITLSDMILESEDPTNCIIDMQMEEIVFRDAGNFKITAYPKYNPEVKATYTIKVTKPLESAALTCDETSPQKYGKSLRFTTTPNGGKGTLTYNYTVTDSNGTDVKTQFNTNKTLNWTPEAVGNYQIKVKVVDSYDNKEVEDSLSFTIDKDDLKIKDEKTITANPITYGDKVAQITLNNAVFVSETAGANVSGDIVFDQPNQVLSAGEHTVAWRFVPNSENYNGFAGSTQVTVQKKTPVINGWPSAETAVYHPSLKLSDIRISSGDAEVQGSWTWVNTEHGLTVPGGTYACRFTPDDSANYYTVDINVSVSVTKATPWLTDLSATAITYGQSLSDSEIGCAAQYSNTDSTVVSGNIAWKNGSIKPNFYASNSTEYDVVFTPVDTSNYNTVDAKAKLIVNKADNPNNLPADRYDVPYSTKVLTNDILADVDDWTFDNTDIGTALAVGEAKKFTAKYIAEDSFNFNNTTIEITIVRNECQHDGETELRNRVVATCVQRGYSGDKYCLVCDTEIESGIATDIDADNHEHTTVIEGREATYEAKGLTEGLVCDDCDTVIRIQEAIAMLNRPDPTAGLSATDKAAVNKISSSLGVTPAQAIEINNFAKSNGISQQTLNITDSTLTTGNTDSDLKGSKYGVLQAYAKKNTKSAITLKWKKVAKADGYLIYGNKCGKNNKMKLLKTYTSNTKLSFTHKKLKKGTYYKYIVVAYKNIGGKKITIEASPTIHSITKGGKYGVAKSVKVTKVGKTKGTKATLKKNQTAAIKAQEVKADKTIKKHRAIIYESTNTKIATVSKKGVIKAVGKGTCYVYAYAQNGIFKKVKVKVN